MYKGNLKKLFSFFVVIGVTLVSCVKENSLYVKPVADKYISVTFVNNVNGEPLILDTLIYETSTGNNYMVNDLQYFVSCICLHEKGGKWMDINPDREVRYIDARIPDTWSWRLKKTAPDVIIDSISFIFGLDCENNISYRYPDPPERDMFWPEILGGGYHYMKLNMKWKNAEMTEIKPFMFHLGIGQVYKGNVVNVDSIIGYVPNFFTVTLPLPGMMKAGQTESKWSIKMNIEKWFDGEYAFDFDDYPKGIMQNQEGMFEGIQNGRHAFDFEMMIGDR